MRLSLCAVAVVVLLGTGCTPKCDPSSCDGCCDEAGACVGGGERAACGRGGETCNTCSGSRDCVMGVCRVASVDAGTDAGEPFDASVPILDGGVTDMDWQQYCEAQADADVARFTRCGVWTSATGANQRAALVWQCVTQQTSSMKKGRVVLVPARIQACIAAYNASPCTESLARGCVGGTVGRLPLNSACFDGECEPALFCDFKTTCPGRCVPRIPLGMPVAVADEKQCASDGYSYGGVCTAPARRGQSCAPIGGSSVNQRCEYATACSTGNVCEVISSAAAGQPCPMAQCALGSACDGTICQPYGDLGDACDPLRYCRSGQTCASGFCVEAPPIALGMACPGGNSQCEGQAFCDGPPLTDGGVGAGSCAALRGAGAACTRTTYARDRACQWGLFCTAPDAATPGTCERPASAGGACLFGGMTDQCIFGTYCTASSTAMSGMCAPRKADGESCSASAECRGLCSRSSCSGSYCTSAWE